MPGASGAPLGHSQDPGCEGLALPMVVFVLMVLGGLVAAAFYLGVAERRAGLATLALQEALGTAETGVLEQLAGWDVVRYNSMPVGSSVGDTVRRPSGEVEVTTRVERLSEALFLLASTGWSGSGATVQVGLLVRLQPPPMAPSAPLMASGPVSVGPLAEVWWSQADWTKGGCTSRRWSGAGTKFGGGNQPTGDLEDFAQWARRATKVVTPGRYASIGPAGGKAGCTTEAPENWGDPTGVSACRDYRPVVLVPGDLTVVGGFGQGVLLVEGDLTVRGSFAFEGLVLVGGSFRSTGGAGRIVGSVQAGLLGEGGIWLGGRARVVHSRCTLDRAALAAGRAVPLGSRSWLYGIK